MDIVKPKNNNEVVAIDSNYIAHENKKLSDVLTDTGWIDLEPLSGTWDFLRYRKIGDIVHVTGYGTCTSSSSTINVANGLPIPKGNLGKYFYFPATGYRISRWLVNPSGYLKIEWTLDMSDNSLSTDQTLWHRFDMSYCTNDE